jgi:anti-sigma factor RsiW
MTITILDRPATALSDHFEFAEFQAFVAAHIRAALADEMIERPGIDPDSLARWLAERVSYSFQLPALADDRFALRGARVDYLAKQGIATVVLQHDRDWISLFILPAAGLEEIRGTHRGHGVLGWAHASASYLAVSEAGTSVLEKLQEALTAATGNDPVRDDVGVTEAQQSASIA